MKLKILYITSAVTLLYYGVFFSGCLIEQQAGRLSSEIEVRDGRENKNESRSRSRDRTWRYRSSSSTTDESSSDGSSGNTDSSTDSSTDGGPISNIRRLADNFSVDDYLDSAVYIYSVIGNTCTNENERQSFQTCVIDCLGQQSETACVDNCKRNSTCDFDEGLGSGVFASSTTILTNEHVVLGDPTAFPIFYVIENHSGNFEIVLDVEWADDTNDVALLRLPQSISGYDVPRFGSLNNLNTLDEVFTIGSPNGKKFVASLGYVSKRHPDIERDCEGIDCLMFAIPIGSGNSGGPIFDSDGELIALVSQGTPHGGAGGYYANLEYGPHIEIIEDLIERNRHVASGPQTSEMRRYKNLSRKEKEKLARNIKEFVLSSY